MNQTTLQRPLEDLVDLQAIPNIVSCAALLDLTSQRGSQAALFLPPHRYKSMTKGIL